jgi:hypothetical protein
MPLRAPVLAIAITALGSPACTLGSVDGGVVDLEDTLPDEALCEVELTLGGTLQPPGGTPASPELGCVPDGVWTVTVAAAGAGGCGELPALGTFTYQVTGEGRDRTITYTGSIDPDPVLGIHAGGNGECEGSFEHVWETGDGEFHVVLLKPYVEPGTTALLGAGSYQRWSERP